MNKLGIWAIAIAFAFVLGTVFSADIATATKPVTEVFLTNTDPIPVTGIVSSPTQSTALGISGSMSLDGCTSISGINVNWLGVSPAQFSSGIQGWITHAEVTETSFVAEGLYNDINDRACASGSLELPGAFTFTGNCGEGVTIDVSSNGGPSGTIIGNAACVT